MRTLLEDQLDVMRAIMRWDPKVHIFGGFAEDAILHGRATRPHVDIDVVAVREDLDLRLEQAEALGARDWELRMEPRAGLPLVIGGFVGEVNLEFVVFERDAEGWLSFVAPTADGLTRTWLPKDALEPTTRTLEGVEVRTVSPLALYQIRKGVEPTFGGQRPKDRVAQAALRRMFFADIPEDHLAPKTDLLMEENAVLNSS